MIETWFDKSDKLEAAIGEPISIANQKRMNNKRTIDGFDTITRVKLGHKCDSVSRACKIGHSEDQEFGATEAKAKYNVSSEHFKDAQILDFPLQCLMKTDRPVTSPKSLDKSQ
ncbi:hypothetical protein PS15m_000495 [Mucor circinelloides]